MKFTKFLKILPNFKNKFIKRYDKCVKNKPEGKLNEDTMANCDN